MANGFETGVNRPCKTGALLLAAGFSNRFGSVKLCAQLHGGQTVFAQTLESLQAAVPELLVITRPELAEYLAPLADSLQVFDEAEKGMGATLAYGISLISDWDACLICLADMPFIRRETYRELAQQATPDTIVVPEYNGQRGNPVAFGSEFFQELTRLRGDHGGRDVLKKHADRQRSLRVGDPAVLYDIDTPEDLEHYQTLAG